MEPTEVLAWAWLISGEVSPAKATAKPDYAFTVSN
jgi:hypothetical protein